MVSKSEEEIDLDSSKRDWEYDGDGTQIVKTKHGYLNKTLWKDFKAKGMYHPKMDFEAK